MSNNNFFHYDLKLIIPSFDSSITDMIIDLEYLKKKRLGGTTHPGVFFQLKHIFHTLESVGSARIEGNNTTVTEYIETKLVEAVNAPPSIREIQNIEKAIEYIESTVKEYPINKTFINEIHSMIVRELLPPPHGEGDSNPGQYRKQNVAIAKSDHTPPDWLKIDEYMEELFTFINSENSPKYDLLKIAIAHHRFVWIHPFSNGNGRTVRLLTYALLVKFGFNLERGRIINPTAIFCNNRNDYYKYLSKADKGDENGILEWCEYVLTGLKDEIEKVDKLIDHDYLLKHILNPAITYSLEREHITELESKILKRTADVQVIQAADIQEYLKGKNNAEVSRQIRKLIEKKMLVPQKEGGRKYMLRFDNNYLLRGIIKSLGENGFLAESNDL